MLVGGPGDLIFKPRNQWHTFWNAGDEPARLLEIISPAGFERFFDELVDLGGVTQAEPQTLAELCARYELEMDPESVPGLVERFDLRFPASRSDSASRAVGQHEGVAVDAVEEPAHLAILTEGPEVDLERLGGLPGRLHLDLDIDGNCDLNPRCACVGYTVTTTLPFARRSSSSRSAAAPWSSG